MVTLMDCIKRIPSCIEYILEKQDEAFSPMEAYEGLRHSHESRISKRLY